MTEDRKPIQVGIDLRPIPLELSDGTVFHFNPDPPKEFFQTVSQLKEDRNDDDSDWEFIDTLRKTLADQVIGVGERKAFTARKFGLAALNKISTAYSEGVLGSPT